ncbi:RNA polymerase II subunit A Cterminal domain phosphatase [Phytophthora megakarya]|uniref:RNA polymerase II subunit A C-terminal domain phosphatase SSU72 n=1 Tax=Phytophthora megakarya TaxID=4795 RepID=A0A225WAG5_9STRA|nr:RNA polymerase II subunit A Cterminal domain phosphatase [Phytophthora megakarya]
MLQFLLGHKKSNHKRQKRRMSMSEARAAPMFAMVCANNVNRSAAAHEILRSAGLRVCSYGAGRLVTFPGHTSSDARTFKFLTPYAVMHSVLEKEDTALFSGNGVLQILARDMPIKKAPERWQSLRNKQLMDIDVVVCLDYAMFLTVLEDIQMRIRLSFKTKQLHVICLDTVDTPEDAVTGGERVLNLCRELNVPTDQLTEEFVKKRVETFEKEHNQQMFYLGLHM